MSNKKRIIELIDKKAGIFTAMNDRVWEWAEICFGLTNSADEICRGLEKEGFTIERGAWPTPLSPSGEKARRGSGSWGNTTPCRA